MRKIKIIFFILIAISLLGISPFNEIKYIPIEDDTSLTKEEYYMYGVPKKIYSLDQLKLIFKALGKIKNESFEALPRYNSKKSQEIFNLLSSDNMERIIKESILYTDKQQFIWAYLGNNLNYPSLTDIYSTNENIYQNELSLCELFQLELNVLSYELYDLLDDKDKGVISDEQKELMSKLLGRLFWSVEFKINGKFEIDEYVKKKIDIELPKIKKRIEKLEIIDSSITFGDNLY